MKPGKPLTFATLARPGAATPCLAFGLPGNPASAAVTFELAVGPALRALAGHAAPLPRRVHAVLGEAAALDPVRPEYARAVATWHPNEADGGGHFLAARTGNQISSRLTSVRGANVLLELPRSAATLPAGTIMTALVVGDLRVAPVGAAIEPTPAP
jgi:gephyrin